MDLESKKVSWFLTEFKIPTMVYPVGPAFKRQIVAWIAAGEKYQLALILIL